jgi:hypothetical protein
MNQIQSSTEVPSKPRKKPNGDYMDRAGPIHLSYQFTVDGVSDFLWCQHSNDPEQRNEPNSAGYAITTSGELIYSANGGLDWDFISLKVGALKFSSEIAVESLPGSFEIKTILDGGHGVVYFITENENILVAEDCSNRLVVLNPMPFAAEYSIEKLLVHKSNPSHVLVFVEKLICPFEGECYLGKVVYYSQDKESVWTKLMEDVEDVEWVRGNESFNEFGILLIINESVELPDKSLRRDRKKYKTTAIYSNNFFIDRYR